MFIVADLSLVHMHNIHPGANIHPGCKFAPGVYFGHVNGALGKCTRVQICPRVLICSTFVGTSAIEIIVCQNPGAMHESMLSDVHIGEKVPLLHNNGVIIFTIHVLNMMFRHSNN